jgi:hypothetical protein
LLAACIFIRNCLQKDKNYEAYLAWPIRLLLYSVSYVLVPFAGIATGIYLYSRGTSHEQRKFGRAAFFVSLVHLLFYLTIRFGGPTAIE